MIQTRVFLFTAVVATAVAAIAMAFAPPATPDPVTQCYDVLVVQCTDCPAYRSKFCNPTSSGIYISCFGSLSNPCLEGSCAEVAISTGPECP